MAALAPVTVLAVAELEAELGAEPSGEGAQLLDICCPTPPGILALAGTKAPSSATSI